MAIREILKMGDARLLRVAQPVQSFGTPELLALVDDLHDTMISARGAGLAAPQIGVDLQVVLFGFVVPRWSRIRYCGVDEQGRPIEREAEGFHARVVQHECDHLIGRLYPTRMLDLTQLGFTSVLFPELDPNADE